MASLGELIVKIGADARGFTKGLNDSTKQINKWGKDAEKGLGGIMDGIGRGIAVVGTAAAAGFGALITGSVSGASSLEQYRNTLNIVMKDQEKAAQTMAWAVDFANKTPFETDSVVEATVKLQSYGLEAQKVLPSVGDMAAVMNKDIMQAVEAVADAQTGELERLKEFGITKQMIVDQGNKIMKGKELVNSKGQIVDQENFNKALFSLMDERFKGGMEIQANSLKGLWSTVTGTFKTTLATMAGISATGEIVVGGLFDKIKTKIKEVVEKLSEWQKNGTLEEWATKAEKAFNTFWAVAEIVFNGIFTAGKFIVDNWGLIGPILAGVLAGFLAFKVVTGILNTIKIAQKALNLVMVANPIALIVLAIAAMVVAGVLLYKNWDTITAKAKELWAKLGEVWESIEATASGIWKSITDSLSKTWNGIKETASTVWNGIKEFFRKWGVDLLLIAIGPVGWSVLLIRKLAENWESIRQTALNIWTSIKTGIANIWSNIISAVAPAALNLYNTVKSKLEDLWNYIKSIPSQALQWGKNIIQGLISGIRSLHIPMPHFDFSVDWHSVAGVSFPVPDVDVDWYKTGGIFTSPTIAGIGDVPEAVTPLSALPDLMADALAGAMRRLSPQSAVATEAAGQPINITLTLDGAVLSRQLVYLNQGKLRGQGA